MIPAPSFEHHIINVGGIDVEDAPPESDNTPEEERALIAEIERRCAEQFNNPR